MSFHHCRMIHGSDVNRGPAAHVHRAAPAGRQEPLSHVPERAGSHGTSRTTTSAGRTLMAIRTTAIRWPSPSSGRPMAPGKARRSGPTGAPREVPFQLVMARRPPRPRPEDGP
jgi:hypothetical protein